MIDSKERLRQVDLVPPNPHWDTLFETAAIEIKSILGANCLAIHHIGSTAIPNIYAKPIIDILPVVKTLTDIESLNLQFEALGYICMGEYGISGRRFYWRSEKERTHHIHLFAEGNTEIARHVAFKDYMRTHPASAEAYSQIKRGLADIFRFDIENYVNGKCSYVQSVDYQTNTATGRQLAAEDNIIIEPYNEAWSKLAQAEINTMKAFSQAPFIAIEHIGSTAVSGLASKPVIDILITVTTLQDAEQWIATLELLGYVFWSSNPNKEHLRFFKGMPPYGDRRTHHVHIVEATNKLVEECLLFRDILQSQAEVKRNYEKLKLSLSRKNSLDREEYTDNKSSFIQDILKKYG